MTRPFPLGGVAKLTTPMSKKVSVPRSLRRFSLLWIDQLSSRVA